MHSFKLAKAVSMAACVQVPACNLAVLLPLTEFLHHYNLNHHDDTLPGKFIPIILGSMGTMEDSLLGYEDAAVRLVEALITHHRSIALASQAEHAKPLIRMGPPRYSTSTNFVWARVLCVRQLVGLH